MASRKFDARNQRARLYFRYGGKQFNKSITAKTDREAERVCRLIEETILNLERGKLIPEGRGKPPFQTWG
jgi:hypothetical protein